MADCIEYRIDLFDEAEKEILIARLWAAGANGFQEEKNMLAAFAPTTNESQLEFERIIAAQGLAYSKSFIKERNWNAEWEAGFAPVTIGNWCRIRALFHPLGEAVKHDIIITPKMSFGTGHHATTHLMIAAMEGLDFYGKTVFDFGTGTGILSILAEKCAAKSITAIDNDVWSIRNSDENFKLNNCCNILLINTEDFTTEFRYDIILANINRNIILDKLLQIKQHLAHNGVVLLSGLLSGDEPVILAEALRYNLRLQQQSAMNGWICLQMVMG